MSKFREYATSTALSISISKAQVDLLSSVSQGFKFNESGHFITTYAALERKGLVISVRKNPARFYQGGEVIEWTHEITNAGKIVVELIKEAGLYVIYKADDTNKHFGVKV